MIDTLLSFIAPHYCYGCQKAGGPLCDNCKYNITCEPYGRCIICAKSTQYHTAICKHCNTSYAKAWCVGERTDELRQLIGGYKFQNLKAAHRPLAELLHLTLPDLPSSTVVVPVPTVAAHVRQRGYDHTLLIARRLVKLRKLKLSSELQRVTSSTQRGSDRQSRIQQAKQAFVCSTQLDPDIPYLLIDDVVTTGATLEYAAQALKAAGAETVWVAVVAHQPLSQID